MGTAAREKAAEEAKAQEKVEVGMAVVTGKPRA
jgi:hypothetical protein